MRDKRSLRVELATPTKNAWINGTLKMISANACPTEQLCDSGLLCMSTGAEAPVDKPRTTITMKTALGQTLLRACTLLSLMPQTWSSLRQRTTTCLISYRTFNITNLLYRTRSTGHATNNPKHERRSLRLMPAALVFSPGSEFFNGTHFPVQPQGRLGQHGAWEASKSVHLLRRQRKTSATCPREL